MAKKKIVFSYIRQSVFKYPRWLRITVGVFFVIGGMLGFLPILGFWMIPLGLIILSYDLSFVRRWRRRLEIYWSRRRHTRS